MDTSEGQRVSESTASTGAGRRGLPRLRRWEMVLAGCAAFLVVGGLALKAYSSLRDDGADARRIAENRGGDLTGDGMSGNSLVGDGSTFPWPRPGETERPGETAETSEVSNDDWSPAMLRGGFGFFVGFAVGFVLRTFFRITTFVAGAALLLLLGLSYAGWIEVRWDVIQDQWNVWAEHLGSELGEFKAFVAGSIPTVGMAGVGVYTGIRKR